MLTASEGRNEAGHRSALFLNRSQAALQQTFLLQTDFIQ